MNLPYKKPKIKNEFKDCTKFVLDLILWHLLYFSQKILVFIKIYTLIKNKIRNHQNDLVRSLHDVIKKDHGIIADMSVIEFIVANEPATVETIHITNRAIPIIQQFLANLGSSCRTTKWVITLPMIPRNIGIRYHALLRRLYCSVIMELGKKICI